LKSARRTDTPHETGAALRSVAKELEPPKRIRQKRLEIGDFGKDVGL
jgi:hypothetical protein